MKEPVYLFMVLIGCKPEGRHTEQHDVFFGIAPNLKELLPQLKQFWPEAAANMHVDAWKVITRQDGFAVQVVENTESATNDHQLYFLNLGGYKENEMEEFHYKMVVVAENKSIAIQKAKASAFYKHTGFAGAASHIDDKYGIDVDDIYAIEDILADSVKQQYHLKLTPDNPIGEDILHLGYFKLSKIENGDFTSS